MYVSRCWGGGGVRGQGTRQAAKCWRGLKLELKVFSVAVVNNYGEEVRVSAEEMEKFS